MTAAPSTGPAAGIVTAARISTGNLASSEPGMDEPADYNIPDALDPAGGLLAFIKACIMNSQSHSITMTCSKCLDRNIRSLSYKTPYTHWTGSSFLRGTLHHALAAPCTSAARCAYVKQAHKAQYAHSYLWGLWRLPETAAAPAGQSDLVQDPTTTGDPVILNPSFGEGTAEDESIG